MVIKTLISLIGWVENHLDSYIVDIKKDEAIVDETGVDYVIPFSFDDELAFKEFQAK